MKKLVLSGLLLVASFVVNAESWSCRYSNFSGMTNYVLNPDTGAWFIVREGQTVEIPLISHEVPVQLYTDLTGSTLIDEVGAPAASVDKPGIQIQCTSAFDVANNLPILQLGDIPPVFALHTPAESLENFNKGLVACVSFGLVGYGLRVFRSTTKSAVE